MALFDLLANACTPQQKLEDAILTNNIENVKRLLEDGVNPDIKLHKFGGDRPLHLAATKGNSEIIELLINAGACVEMSNDSDVTPIYNAFRANHCDALQLLLKHCKLDKRLNYLWVEGLYVEMNVPDEAAMQRLAILSSPNLLLQKHHLRPSYWDIFFTVNLSRVSAQFGNFSPLGENIKLLFLTSFNGRGSEFCSYVKKVFEKFDRLKNFTFWGADVNLEKVQRYKDEMQTIYDFLSEMKRNPSSLRHLCRLEIRGSFLNKCNVFYGVDQLPLPTQLKEFLIFDN